MERTIKTEVERVRSEVDKLVKDNVPFEVKTFENGFNVVFNNAYTDGNELKFKLYILTKEGEKEASVNVSFVSNNTRNPNLNNKMCLSYSCGGFLNGFTSSYADGAYKKQGLLIYKVWELEEEFTKIFNNINWNKVNEEYLKKEVEITSNRLQQKNDLYKVVTKYIKSQLNNTTSTLKADLVKVLVKNDSVKEDKLKSIYKNITKSPINYLKLLQEDINLLTNELEKIRCNRSK